MCNDEVNAVVELLSKDVQCLEQTHLVHFLWAAPLQLVIAAYFTWDAVGISALAGVLLVVLWFLPAQGKTRASSQMI